MELTRRRVLAARTLAIVADAIQFGLLPLFVEGAASIVNDILDVVVAAGLVALVGWHWAFMPAFLAELVPVVDIAPTWTLAVFIATRHAGSAGPEPPPGASSRPQPEPPSDEPRLLPPEHNS